jgi:LPS export ABC transporter protein LptC
MGDTGLIHRGSRIILPFLIIPLISYVIFFLNTGINKRNLSNQEKRGPVIQEADTRIDEFTLFQTNNGKVDLEMRAKRAEVFEEEEMALLRDVKVTINREGGMRVYLVGDSGSVNTSSKDFRIDKKEMDTRINLGDDLTVITSSIRWINKNREVISDSPVEIRRRGIVIKGNQFVANLDTQEFEVSGDVETYIDR